MVVTKVSVVDSETDRKTLVSGTGRDKLDGEVLVPGSAEVSVDIESLDVGDDVERDRSEGGASIVSDSSGADGRVQDANAARCNGRQPWRDSLILAASGYISISMRMNLHTSMNGSDLLCGA